MAEQCCTVLQVGDQTDSGFKYVTIYISMLDFGGKVATPAFSPSIQNIPKPFCHEASATC
jgi:hypothetical protein